MRFYAITFDKVVIRFYLMMAVVLIGMFSGYYAIALLALPLFLSAILGIQFGSAPAKKKATPVISLPATQPRKDKVA
ncbi:hypothetical protein [Lewinella sp. IMCC34183]|uniref:hypothetical protein n=1 Tax=Lewinella sp. IMCC34183 TaxID=2248762 RepID=UPI000E259100|nr:hypothetical protein [Lewinella sp. IMCC34183]